MELTEVSNMEMMKCLLTAGNEKEAVVEDNEPDPNDIADWQYKDWLENQYLQELENSQQR